MRRRLGCTVLVAAMVASCGCGRSPAPVDGAQDEDSGPPDAGPLSWEVTPELEVLSEAPCPDWGAIEPTPRGLPTDATPRQLWRYFAYEQDVYRESGLANQYLGEKLSIGPDGSVYAVGPEENRILKIGPDGTLQWFTDPIVAVDGDRLVVAPDGSVLFTGTNAEDEVWLIRVSRGGQVLFRRNLGWSPEPIPSSGRAIALGPRARVYLLLLDGTLEASCFGAASEVRWRMRFWDSNHRQVRVDRFATMPDGTLWANLENRRSTQLSSSGGVVGYFPAAPLDSTATRTSFIRPGEFFVRYYDDSTPERWWYEVWVDSRRVVEMRATDSALVIAASPVRQYWVTDYGSRQQAVYGHDGLVREPGPAVLAWPIAVFAEDGSCIGKRYPRSLDHPERNDIVRVETQGTVVWSFRPTGRSDSTDWVRAGGTTGYEMALHQNGVLYTRATQDWNNYVIAIQTDQLPSSEPGCWDPGCNPRRNNWMGSP